MVELVSHNMTIANTRPGTSSIAQLPHVLVKGLQAGIIPPPSKDLRSLVPELPKIAYNESSSQDDQDLHTLDHHYLIMPEMWVKGKQEKPFWFVFLQANVAFIYKFVFNIFTSKEPSLYD